MEPIPDDGTRLILLINFSQTLWHLPFIHSCQTEWQRDKTCSKDRKFGMLTLYKLYSKFIILKTFPSVSPLAHAVATFPDELGTSVPLTEDEQKDLLYVPQDGEWGCRTRAEECERIIKAIDQLCMLGMMSPAVLFM